MLGNSVHLYHRRVKQAVRIDPALSSRLLALAQFYGDLELAARNAEAAGDLQGATYYRDLAQAMEAAARELIGQSQQA